MSTQHLSDEAVAAFADGVLTGHARERATRHTASCAECAQAVRVQREAAWALRAAPAPALPVGLMDRLCGLPQVTPISTLPTVVAPDGSTMLSTMAPVAAFSPASRADAGPRTGHRGRPFATTAAVVAVAGALAAGALINRAENTPATTGSDHGSVQRPDAPRDIAPAVLFSDVSAYRLGGR